MADQTDRDRITVLEAQVESLTATVCDLQSQITLSYSVKLDDIGNAIGFKSAIDGHRAA